METENFIFFLENIFKKFKRENNGNGSLGDALARGGGSRNPAVDEF